ncbi:MAG: TRAP transporter small permease [Eubacteriales bacterium]|jgi:TRAP-type C4-dicarboxylate transport system permease small subunit|nr:TRAP transporter small permease [Eubacteriales bacterium]
MKTADNEKLLPGEKTARLIIEWYGKAAGAVLIAAMLIIVVDVAGRALFAQPIVGCAEIVIYMMVCLATMGLGWCALNEKHIEVEVLTNRFPPRVQKVLKQINYLFVMGVSLLIAFQAAAQAMVERELHIASTLRHIPSYPFYLVAAISYVLLFLTVAMLFFKSVFGEAKK